MNHVLWSPQKQLKLADHRLLWWMLAHQEVRDGVGTGRVPKGWRQAAEREMNVHARWIQDAVARLKAAGLIDFAHYERGARIRGEAFELSKKLAEIEREAQAEAVA